MKTLYIMRHAQKDTSTEYMDDYDVELTQKGKEDAKNIALKLKEKPFLVDSIVSSPAIRARQTADIVASNIEYKKNIMYNEVIYKAFLNEIVESITYTFDDIDKLMVVGHNPSLSAVGFSFTGIKERLEMGEIFVIEFNCSSWLDIDKSNAKLIEHIKL